MDKQQADSLVAEFGKQLGLPDLALADAGCWATFDGPVTVGFAFDPESGTMTLEARLDGVDLDPDRMKRAMAANFCWMDTGGAVFGLDRLGDQLVLRRRLPAASLDLAGLRSAVEALVIYTRAWTNRLGAGEQAEQAPAARRPIEAVLRA